MRKKEKKRKSIFAYLRAIISFLQGGHVASVFVWRDVHFFPSLVECSLYIAVLFYYLSIYIFHAWVLYIENTQINISSDS